MQSPENKVAIARKDAASDKALSLLPITPEEEKERRIHREAERPPPVKLVYTSTR